MIAAPADGHVAIDATGMLQDADGDPVRAASSEPALRATLGILDRTVRRGYPDRQPTVDD